MADLQEQAAGFPSWWTAEHSSGWERAKHALQRDWEQTKGDLADTGVDLNQGAMDTIRQAVGSQPIPVDSLPNPGPRHAWAFIEPAVRYGYGARLQYGEGEGTAKGKDKDKDEGVGAAVNVWHDSLTDRLRSEWAESGQVSSWESVKEGVAHGWHSVRRAL